MSVVILATVECLYSQKQTNNWYFGYGAGLDFNSSPPSVLTNSAMQSGFGCASISDKNGNLLFYTNGKRVWDKTHNLMPNGTSLSGDSASLNAALIIQVPQKDSLFYIFSVNGKFIYYSMIDLTLNGGDGDVTSAKNVILNNNSDGTLAATPHGSCRKIWLLTRTFNSNQYIAYSIDHLGISSTSVVSSVGSAGVSGINYSIHRFSQQGDKFVNSYSSNTSNWVGFFELYQFDNITGIISSPIKIPNIIRGPYSAEFSPNGKVLYGSSAYGLYDHLYQWDISIHDSSSILNSQILIDSTFNKNHHDLQLGNDGKIYISILGSSITSPAQDSLSLIANPDILGQGCGFAENAIYLQGNTTAWSFPKMMGAYNQRITITDSCFGDTTKFRLHQPNAFLTYYWSFGDSASGPYDTSSSPNPGHVFTDTGFYTVRVIGLNQCFKVDTFIDTIHIITKPQIHLGDDTILCSNDSIQLNAGPPQYSYLWSTNSVQPEIKVSESGIFWVRAENECGVDFDTIEVIKDVIDVFLGNDIVLCSRDPVNQVLTAPNASSYLWSTGATTSNINVTQFGKYWVEVTSFYDCKGSDTLEIIPVNCTGIEENKLNDINLYPNPNTGDFIIQSDQFWPELEVNITDLQGKTIYHQHFSSAKKVNCQFTSTPGMYIVEIKMNNDLQRRRIVVK